MSHPHLEDKVVYKYLLELNPSQDIRLPTGCNILSIQVQNDLVTMWAEVPIYVEGYTLRRINMTSTGHKVPSGKFIATVQLDMCVWHFYDDGEQGYVK